MASPSSAAASGRRAHSTRRRRRPCARPLVRHDDGAGYAVLAITERLIQAVAPSTRQVVIPAAGLSAGADGPERNAPVPAAGPQRRSAPFAEVVGRILARGGVPSIAHTYWSGLRTDRFEARAGLACLEVSNAGARIEVESGDQLLHGDEALERRRDVTPARLERAPAGPYSPSGVEDAAGQRVWATAL